MSRLKKKVATKDGRIDEAKLQRRQDHGFAFSACSGSPTEGAYSEFLCRTYPLILHLLKGPKERPDVGTFFG